MRAIACLTMKDIIYRDIETGGMYSAYQTPPVIYYNGEYWTRNTKQINTRNENLTKNWRVGRKAKLFFPPKSADRFK